jgi:hypothetical protein
VQLENLLCDIHPDSCNLHSGPSRSSFSMVSLPSLAHYEAVELGLGPSHHSERSEESRLFLSPYQTTEKSKVRPRTQRAGGMNFSA